MAGDNQSAATVASNNLKTAWVNPVTKVGVAIFVFLIIILGAVSIAMLRGKASKPGAAEADSYSVSGGKPRGAVDPATAKAVEARSDAEATKAMDQGKSFGGPFVFEGAAAEHRSGSYAGFDDSGGSVSSGGASTAQPTEVISSLRSKAAEYDRSEEGQSSAGGRVRTGVSRGARSSMQGPEVVGYGVSPQAFGQISAQLATVGTSQVRYESLPNGVLNKPPAPVEVKQVAAGAAGVVPAASKVSPREVIAARAGQICGALPDTEVNTDFSVPVFFEVLDCGLLTGAKVRGVVAKTPDDFTIHFSKFSLDPKKGYRLVTEVEGLSVSVKNDGSPGVADNVNNHWGTRLASSALLSLAKTETNLLGARGSSVINTGTSTSVSIDPLSSSDKRAALLAGLVGGSMDVVAKDVSVGVNRPATMTLNKSTLIGIQFMSDVKVVPNE